MPNREKVMWSLARCSCGVPDACSDCYYDNLPPKICVQHLTNDALVLLKAQEPIAPVVECDEYPDCTPNGFELYYCGACGDDIADGQKFCSNCGRQVKWK